MAGNLEFSGQEVSRLPVCNPYPTKVSRLGLLLCLIIV